MISQFQKIRRQMLKQKKILNYIVYAIGEILLIVIGILLALYLQNKNEAKKIEQSIQTNLTLLKDEITTNKKAIEGVRDYHIMIKDTLKKIELPKTEQELNQSFSFWRGMQTRRLQNAAFQTSIQSGINKEFNPKLLRALNNLYTYQDSYNDFNAASSQIFFNADFSNVNSFGKIISSIQITMNDLYYFEMELLEMLNHTLTLLEKTHQQQP